YRKDRFIKAKGDIFGNGLIVSEGDFWRRQRRLIQPAFHPRRLDGYAPAMVACTERLARDWNSGEVRDLHDEMVSLTVAIAVRTLFGVDRDDAAVMIRGHLRAMNRYFERPFGMVGFLKWLPTPTILGYHRARRAVDDFVYRIIDERRRSEAEGDDLLSRLLAARDEDGSRMSDRQLRDEVMTLFLAGHETTALLLTYTLYLLARNPEAESRLLAEFDAVLGGRTPAAEDVPRLVYTQQVIRESLRLYSPSYAFARECVEADEMRGWRVPVGTTMVFSQWAVHRDPRTYEDPEAFRPERWTPAFMEGLPRFAYFPFGGGPRVCVGAEMTMLEASLVLPTILQRFRLRVRDGAPLRLRPSIALRPEGGLPMRIEKR
ncbi:MAG: cytochrome P450, partial [Myxococcales bacterium]|nr:cytochrome P450 [Myxococcales bacterium]